MKNFFRYLATVLLAMFLPLAASCHHAHAAPFRVLATTFPVWLFTSNVCTGAKDVKVELLIPANAGCPHDLALRPADLRKIAAASVLVINGAGLEEHLLEKMKSAAPGLAIVDAGLGITPLPSGDHDHPNGHIFASPKMAALMVGNIAAGLSLQNPVNESIFSLNAQNYAGALDGISQKFAETGLKAKNKKIALEHDALAYLAANASLEVVAIFESSMAAAQLKKLEDRLKTEKPAMLAGDSQYPSRLLETISQDTGIPFGLLNTCTNGPADAPLDYYQQKMNENLKILEAHLGQ